MRTWKVILSFGRTNRSPFSRIIWRKVERMNGLKTRVQVFPTLFSRSRFVRFFVLVLSPKERFLWNSPKRPRLLRWKVMNVFVRPTKLLVRILVTLPFTMLGLTTLVIRLLRVARSLEMVVRLLPIRWKKRRVLNLLSRRLSLVRWTKRLSVMDRLQLLSFPWSLFDGTN